MNKNSIVTESKNFIEFYYNCINNYNFIKIMPYIKKHTNYKFNDKLLKGKNIIN